MRVFEWTAAGMLALLGMRSLGYWLRRPFESRAVADQVLYSLWVLSRAGLWFAVAGIFAISGSIGVQGRAFLDQWSGYRWYILVPLALAAIQALTSHALGRGE